MASPCASQSSVYLHFEAQADSVGQNLREGTRWGQFVRNTFAQHTFKFIFLGGGKSQKTRLHSQGKLYTAAHSCMSRQKQLIFLLGLGNPSLKKALALIWDLVKSAHIKFINALRWCHPILQGLVYVWIISLPDDRCLLTSLSSGNDDDDNDNYWVRSPLCCLRAPAVKQTPKALMLSILIWTNSNCVLFEVYFFNIWVEV